MRHVTTLRSRNTLVLAAAAAVALLPSCGFGDDVHLQDDVGYDIGLFSDSLSPPYARGSTFHVWADGAHAGWRLESSDTSVLVLEPDADAPHDRALARVAHALGAGTTELRVRDEDGDVVERRSVDVMEADRIEIVAHRAFLDGAERDGEPLSEARIMVGGGALFQARLFAGDIRLTCSNVLDVSGPEGVAVNGMPMGTDEGFLALVTAEGTFELALGIAGRDVPFRVIGVAPDAITTLEMLDPHEPAAHDGQMLMLVAQPRDADGHDVFGGQASWEVEGRAQQGMGDAFLYAYSPTAAPREVRARIGTSEARASVHMQGQGGIVTQSDITCAAAPGAAHGGLGLLALGALLAGALVVRRRSSGVRHPRLS